MPTPAPKPSSRITAPQWDLLDALWALGPATARQVADHLTPTRGWAYSTVKTMLDRMAAKGLVAARQVGNVWEYTPAVEVADARRSAWRRFVDAAFGGATQPALAFVMKEAKLTPRQRQALLDALDEPAVRSTPSVASPAEANTPKPAKAAKPKENTRD